ncbi:hypothetical protein [Mucilaginibacter agri]|nr:hypothetical protein [Mucilaginibacter agri]
MSATDQDFREEFKPLHIPAHYNAGDSEQDKIIYALAQLQQATSDEVATELAKHDPTISLTEYQDKAASVLNILFGKGLIKGINVNGSIKYNLSKITHANDGTIDPELLAPGLD